MPEDDDNDFDLDLDLGLDADPPAPAPAPPLPAKPKPLPAERPVQSQPATPPERPAAPSRPAEQPPEPEDPTPIESALQAAATRLPSVDPNPSPEQSTLQPAPELPPEPALELPPEPALELPPEPALELPPQSARESALELPPSPQPEGHSHQIPPPGSSRSIQQLLDPSTPPDTTQLAPEQEPKKQRARRRTQVQPEPQPHSKNLPPPSKEPTSLKKKLLIGVPIALLAVLIGSKLLSDRKPDEPMLNVREIQETAGKTTPPVPPENPPDIPEVDSVPIDRDSETPEERSDRAEATLGNFFGATKKERMIAYVRHPERVKPLMLDYYSREPFKTHEFLGLMSDLQPAESIGPNFYAAEADIGGPRSQTMILEDTPKGFRIDWEYYVQYNPMNWSTFLKEAPAPAMDFRVYANLVPDYRHPFADESRYIGVLLMTLNDTTEIMGYAERDSELGKRLDEFLKNKHEELCILRLQFPTGPNPDTVYIRELVNPHWIFTDETSSE